MSDFCKECSEAIFGQDFKELAGISSEKETQMGLYARVLCEGCGLILVNHEGKRFMHVRGVN